jgi:hypothetical protein
MVMANACSYITFSVHPLDSCVIRGVVMYDVIQKLNVVSDYAVNREKRGR